MALEFIAKYLSRKAELVTGLALYRGWSWDRISGMLAKRFLVATGLEALEILHFANEGRLGGMSLQGRQPADPIDLSLIPINPYLYADEPEGRRALIVADIQLQEQSNYFTTYLDLPDLYDMEDLYTQIDVSAGIIWEYIKGQGVIQQDVEHSPLDIQFIFAERRW